jgi:hypothetical protein
VGDLNNHEIRTRIENRLRKILDIYIHAQSMADFKDTILAVHTAIDDALNLDLTPEERKEPFSKKVMRFDAELYSFYQINEATLLRNEIAHPTRPFSDAEVRQAAKTFVDFAIAAWPNLFESQPPYILHPDNSQTLPIENDFYDSQPSPLESEFYASQPLPPPPPLIFPDELPDFSQAAEPVPPAPETTLPPPKKHFTLPRFSFPTWTEDLFHLPWHHLLFSFASAWMGIMLIGLMVHLIRASTSTLLLLGFAMLIFFIACLGYLVHFLLRFGLKRTFAVILTVLMVTTLFFSLRQPAGTNLSTRIVDGFGMTLTTPFFWASQIGQLAYESGREFGQRYFKQDEMVDIGEPQNENQFERDMRTLFPSTGEPTLSEPTTAPPPTAQPEILRPAGVIQIGGRVKIETDGSRLRGRDAPGMSGNVVTMFEPGAIVRVLEGPVDADGYTWWKVEGGDQVGWSASNFMTPVE